MALRKYIVAQMKLQGQFYWLANPAEWVKNSQIPEGDMLLYRAAKAPPAGSAADIFYHWADVELGTAWLREGWSLVEDYATFEGLSERDKFARTAQAWQAYANACKALNVNPWCFQPFAYAMERARWQDYPSVDVMSSKRAEYIGLNPEFSGKGLWRKEAIRAFLGRASMPAELGKSRAQVDAMVVPNRDERTNPDGSSFEFDAYHAPIFYAAHHPRYWIDSAGSFSVLHHINVGNSKPNWDNRPEWDGNNPPCLDSERWDDVSAFFNLTDKDEDDVRSSARDAADMADEYREGGGVSLARQASEAASEGWYVGIIFHESGRQATDLIREVLSSALELPGGALEMISRARRWASARNFSTLKMAGASARMSADDWKAISVSAEVMPDQIEAAQAQRKADTIKTASTIGAAIGTAIGTIAGGVLGKAMGGVGSAVGSIVGEVYLALAGEPYKPRDCFGRQEPSFETYALSDDGTSAADQEQSAPFTVSDIMPPPPAGTVVEPAPSPPVLPPEQSTPTPQVLPPPTYDPGATPQSSYVQPSKPWLLYLALAVAAGVVVWDQTKK